MLTTGRLRTCIRLIPADHGLRKPSVLSLDSSRSGSQDDHRHRGSPPRPATNRLVSRLAWPTGGGEQNKCRPTGWWRSVGEQLLDQYTPPTTVVATAALRLTSTITTPGSSHSAGQPHQRSAGPTTGLPPAPAATARRVRQRRGTAHREHQRRRARTVAVAATAAAAAAVSGDQGRCRHPTARGSTASSPTSSRRSFGRRAVGTRRAMPAATTSAVGASRPAAPARRAVAQPQKHRHAAEWIWRGSPARRDLAIADG